jgi:hypothetical protein
MLSRFWSFHIRAPIAASPSRHPPRSSMDQAEGLIPMQNYKSWGLLAWITWIEIGRFTNKARGTPQKIKLIMPQARLSLRLSWSAANTHAKTWWMKYFASNPLRIILSRGLTSFKPMIKLH